MEQYPLHYTTHFEYKKPFRGTVGTFFMPNC